MFKVPGGACKLPTGECTFGQLQPPWIPYFWDAKKIIELYILQIDFSLSINILGKTKMFMSPNLFGTNKCAALQCASSMPSWCLCVLQAQQKNSLQLFTWSETECTKAFLEANQRVLAVMIFDCNFSQKANICNHTLWAWWCFRVWVTK